MWKQQTPAPPPPWSCHLVGRQMINKSTERKELLVVKVLFIPKFLIGQWIWAWHWGSTNDPGRRGPYPMWNFAEPRFVCRLLLPAQSVPFNHSPWTDLHSRQADDTGNPKGLSLPPSIFSSVGLGSPRQKQMPNARGLTRNTAVREKREAPPLSGSGSWQPDLCSLESKQSSYTSYLMWSVKSARWGRHPYLVDRDTESGREEGTYCHSVAGPTSSHFNLETPSQASVLDNLGLQRWLSLCLSPQGDPRLRGETEARANLTEALECFCSNPGSIPCYVLMWPWAHYLTFCCCCLEFGMF